MSVAPLVRRVIVCEKVDVDRAQPGYPYTLRRVLATLRPPEGLAHPYLAPELWVFAQFVDGVGTHPVTIELVRVDLESEAAVEKYQLPPVHMTAGRFAVLNRAYKLTKVSFPRPGIYEFRVRCGGNTGTDEVRSEDGP